MRQHHPMAVHRRTDLHHLTQLYRLMHQLKPIVVHHHMDLLLTALVLHLMQQHLLTVPQALTQLHLMNLRLHM